MALRKREKEKEEDLMLLGIGRGVFAELWRVDSTIITRMRKRSTLYFS